MSLEISVRCGCGRDMRSDGARGRGHMLCGCGARAYVEVPNRIVYEHGMCAWVDGAHGCTDGAIHAKIPLCEAHVRQAVTFASDHRWLLAANLAERQQYPKLAQDIEATPEAQELSRQERFRQNVAKQRAKITDAVDAAGVVVYYVRLGGDRIKIGVTSDLKARLAAFRAPVDDLLAVEPGGYDQEMARHRQFEHLRIKRPGSREEYTATDDLVKHIASVVAEHGNPLDVARRQKLAALAELRDSGPLLFGPNQDLYDRLEAGLRAEVVA